jgi:hypothetical protein
LTDEAPVLLRLEAALQIGPLPAREFRDCCTQPGYFFPFLTFFLLSLLQNKCLPSLSFRPFPLSFRPQGEISGGKVRDFSLSLEMTGNNVSSIFAHQQSRYFASGSVASGVRLLMFTLPPCTVQ